MTPAMRNTIHLGMLVLTALLCLSCSTTVTIISGTEFRSNISIGWPIEYSLVRTVGSDFWIDRFLLINLFLDLAASSIIAFGSLSIVKSLSRISRAKTFSILELLSITIFAGVLIVSCNRTFIYYRSVIMFGSVWGGLLSMLVLCVTSVQIGFEMVRYGARWSRYHGADERGPFS